MIYMKITKTHYSDMSLKLSTISDDTLIPLRKCKNLKQATKKVRKLTSYNFKGEPLRIKNNVAMYDYVIEVINV